MKSATVIRKRGVKITVSPTFLDYYEPPDYVIADAVAWRVETCAGGVCATYARRGSWRFGRRVRCGELGELRGFLERALSNAPDWPVFWLVAEVARSLELLMYKVCGSGRQTKRYA